MQKEQFERRIRSILPEVTDPAMASWTEYAKELEQDEVETEAAFYDATYVELSLIKQHHGEDIATQLFNYGERFTFNYFELRGAAAKLVDKWSLEEIVNYTLEHGCDPTQEEFEESQTALRAFQMSERKPADMQMM